MESPRIKGPFLLFLLAGRAGGSNREADSPGLAGFPKQWPPAVRMWHPPAEEPDAPHRNVMSQQEGCRAKVIREKLRRLMLPFV